MGDDPFLWSLPLVVGGQLLVVLFFSEVAATFPLAGALYLWGRRLVGPRYGFFVGWSSRPSVGPGKRGSGQLRGGAHA